MRQALTTGQTLEIKTEGAQVVNLALVSGEVIFRVGDNAFVDASDDKLTENIPTYSIPISAPTSIWIKAVQASEIQYRRE